MVNEGSINLEKVDKLYEAYDSTRSDLMGKLMELGVEIEILGNKLPHDQVATNRAQLEDTEKALDNLEMRFKDQTQPYIDQLKIKYADHPETIMQNPLDFLFFNRVEPEISTL